MNKINPLTRSNSHRMAAFGVLGALTLAACGSDTADTDDELIDPAQVEAEAADETTEAETAAHEAMLEKIRQSGACVWDFD